MWLHLRGKPYTPVPFRSPWLYRQVRHPLYVGWLMIFWATPVMTVAHLVFAIMTTAYILVAIQFEERDLITEHPEYREYRPHGAHADSLQPPLGARRAGGQRFGRESGVMNEEAEILARHWREARAMNRFDARRFEGLAKLVVSVQLRALGRRLSFVQWAGEQWARQQHPRDRQAA